MKNDQQHNLIKKTHLQQIKGAFSELSWQKARLITAGCDNNVIILDSKLVFRFPKNKDAHDKLKREVTTLSTLGSIITLPIPKISFIDHDLNFIGYPLVKGAPILPKLITAKLSSEQLEDFQQNLVNFLKQLHSVATQRALKKYLPKKVASIELRELKTYTNKYLKKILKESELEIIGDFFTAYKNAYLAQPQASVIHGDLSWEHLLFNRANKLSGVIDFSDVVYGDPAIDFSCFWDYGAKFVKTVCKLYSPQNYQELYLRSKLHYQKVAIILMIESQRSSFFKFDDAHKMFKKRFRP